jgi:hypothetical protein
MPSDKLYRQVVEQVRSAPDKQQWLTAMKYYFAYFITLDQMNEISQLPEIQACISCQIKNVNANLAWFQQYGTYESYDALMDAQRPFVWKLEDLQREFPDHITYFVNLDAFDFSKATVSEDPSIVAIEWLEEYGLIETCGLLFSRTIQPVVVDGKPSEPIVLAMPIMDHQKVAEVFQAAPSMGGGAVLTGRFVASHINVSFGDHIGISGVDTVMCFFDIDHAGIESDPYVGVEKDGHKLIA